MQLLLVWFSRTELNVGAVINIIMHGSPIDVIVDYYKPYHYIGTSTKKDKYEVIIKINENMN